MLTTFIHLPLQSPQPAMATTNSSSCIFCKIVDGSAPCHKLWEDDLTMAFLDINPLSPFHTLLIPKRHYERIEQVDEETAKALGQSLQKISKVMNAESGDFNILLANGRDAGQEVWHAHYHFIPRGGKGDGLGFRWKVGRLLPQPQIDDFLAMAKEILSEGEKEEK